MKVTSYIVSISYEVLYTYIYIYISCMHSVYNNIDIRLKRGQRCHIHRYGIRHRSS